MEYQDIQEIEKDDVTQKVEKIVNELKKYQCVILDQDWTTLSIQHVFDQMNHYAGVWWYKVITPELIEIISHDPNTIKAFRKHVWIWWKWLINICMRRRWWKPRIESWLIALEDHWTKAIIELEDLWIHKAIVSSNNYKNIYDLHKELPIQQIVSTSMFNSINSKKNSILKIIKKAKLKKKDVCYVGDQINDWLASKKAGIDFVWVSKWLHHPDLLTKYWFAKNVLSL